MTKTTLLQASPAKVGQRVSWKASGKVSRIEGVAGKVVWGKVKRVNRAELALTVMPDHRTLPNALFKLDARIEFRQVLEVADAQPGKRAKSAQ